jgi:anaerobic selenocysteine-containing dehydrogenase
MPGVVSLPHGWGHDLDGVEMSVAVRRPGVNSNLLSDEERTDPISGNAVLNGIPVTVEPAAALA